MTPVLIACANTDTEILSALREVAEKGVVTWVDPSYVEVAYAIRSYPTVTTLRRPWGRLVR